MKRRYFCHKVKYITLLLILFGYANSFVYAQKNLSGKINQPSTHVVNLGKKLYPSRDSVEVASVDGFNVGDTVLIIQMQGVEILTGDLSYGTLQDKLGEPGMHEFLIIKNIDGLTKTIVFTNFLLNDYDPLGNVQLVRVPYYNSAVVNGTLYCDPWDPATKAGGVLALIIGRTIKLNSDIDVSSKGFWGGQASLGDGLCWNGVDDFKKEYYPASYTNAGFKGEGLAIHDEHGVLLSTFAVKGLGANFTGGGGGNAKFSGGGGGSNWGEGGVGGFEECAPPLSGGRGGFVTNHSSLDKGIFFGGGGGSSTTVSGTAGAGGNGGGIVIIVADTLLGNGGNILSNGANGGNATGSAGSGGGGAAGSIALSLNSYGLTPIRFYLKGGKGGDNSGTSGEGGGGGGGLLYISTNTSSNATYELTGGLPGNDPSSTANPGGDGEKRTEFKAILNGFLFNSIRSSVTGDQVDSICSNVLPPKITGTIPVGGKTPYTYKWEKSYDEAFTTPILLTEDAVSINYSPTVIETSTVWYRRTVTDYSVTPLVDISKPVKIKVQPFIKGNIIGTSDTICFAQDPPTMISKDVLLDGNGIYSFKWEVSVNDITYGNPADSYKNESYTPPPALQITSWYRRTVTSGRCIDTSLPVKITVLPSITGNNILSVPQEICFGSSFTNLTATVAPVLAGGDDSYRYKWESNINGSGWNIAPGTNNGPGYNPTELSEKAPFNEYIFRRVVYSGIHDVCVNTSGTIILKDFPVITNNIIPANQTICSGSSPAKIVGSGPLNGNGTYTYTWQDSSKAHTWADIPGYVNVATSDYQPPSLVDTTSYRRIVYSSACFDISKAVMIVVHKPIVNNSISFLSGATTDTTICSGATPNRIKGTSPSGGTNLPGDYVFQWLYSTDNNTWSPVASLGTGIDYQPPALTLTTYYKRQTTSGACIDITSVTVTVNVLPLISGNVVTTSQSVCYNTVPSLLNGTTLTGGAGTGSYTFLWQESPDGLTWVSASGVNNALTGSYQPPSLTMPIKYRRIVYSGAGNCCQSISNVISISINPLPTGSITNVSDTTICGGNAVNLNIHLTGTSQWKVTFRENSADKAEYTVSGANAVIPIFPASLSSVNVYTYSLGKVVDNNGCIATMLTGSKKSTVYKVPVAYAGSDITVCGPEVTLNATPSSGTGLWSFPSAVIASTANTASVTVTVDSTFAGSNVIHRFFWEETNWQCKSKDSTDVTFNKRIASINAGPDTSLYSFDNLYRMNGDNSVIGQGVWTLVSGSGSFDNSSDSKTVVNNLSKGINSFMWTITNGTCKREDMVTIEINELIIPEGFSPNNDPDGYNNTFIIRGLDLSNQIAELKVVNGAGTEVFSTSNVGNGVWTDWDGKNAKGSDLPEGTYYYLLKITSKGNGKVFKKSGFIILKRY
jgi:hypothetical protein